MTYRTDIDIKASADEVVASLRRGNTREAMGILERERHGEDLVVQEALDRYVGKELTALRQNINNEDALAFSVPLQRLEAANSGMPRFPVETELREELTEVNRDQDRNYFSPEVRYDLYASIVQIRGNDSARSDLEDGTQRVILGLRQENSTFDSMQRDNASTPNTDESQNGKGVYDDRLIVLWRGANGVREVYETEKGANTEPTAQYDHHAGSNGARDNGQGGIEARRIAPSAGYENILSPRKIEGEDVNNDAIRDLGRLAQGTVEMRETTHPNGRHITDFALRPTPAAVNADIADRLSGMVQRDTNADGWFTQADVSGVQNLNNSFKIHLGSRGNTDSAGCQTVHRDDYETFVDAIRGNANQDHWQYVLTATSPGMFRGVNVQQENGRPAAPERRDENHREQAPRQPVRPVEQDHRDGPPLGPPRAALDPRDRNHPDHALYQQALTGVHQHDAKLGRTPDDMSERMAASLTALAKENGLSRIDHVVFSVDTGRGVKAGENVFVVRGELGNPAADRAHMKTEVAVNTSVQDSFQKLDVLSQQQAQDASQQQTQQHAQLAQQQTNRSAVHAMT